MKIKSESPIPLEEAAQLIGCSVRTLLYRAGQGEILLYVGLTEFSATLMARPWCENPLRQTPRQAPNSYEILGTRYANDLAITGQAVIASCPAGIKPPMDDYFWHLDTPQTVGIDRIFMAPDTQDTPAIPSDKLDAESERLQDGRGAEEWITEVLAEHQRRMATNKYKKLAKADKARALENFCKENNIENAWGRLVTYTSIVKVLPRKE